MAEFGVQIKNIAQDLLNLEVNTIIKANMTGRKMPAPRHALIDIAQNYNLKLTDLGLPVQQTDAGPGSFESFHLIREKTNEGMLAIRKRAAKKHREYDEADMVMLHRIKRMSDQIKGIFKGLEKKKAKQWDNNLLRDDIDDAPPLPLATNDLVMIRKIWEMGLEEIAMQTIIQLDGDVLTRVQAKYANEESAILHKLHNQSVSTSLRFWGELIGIVKEFFGSLAKSLF
ncbi:MAG TPA: hypothetical protein ENK58_09795 [Desulfobacterales bacterium]|nr:hypothetical protein [Desulfobacterales bacterium]